MLPDSSITNTIFAGLSQPEEKEKFNCLNLAQFFMMLEPAKAGIENIFGRIWALSTRATRSKQVYDLRSNKF